MQTYQRGERIINNKYTVEKLLGKGAFGEVYLCKHLDLQVWRAIKVVHRGLPGLGSTIYDELYQRFQQEARIGARIKHENIIQVFDFEKIDDFLFLILEYADGGSLLDRLESRQESGKWIKESEVIKIGLEVAQGLTELHSHQIVHRDLKPSNILIGKNDIVKIADLGLAQIPGGMSQRSMMGSMVVMQPHPGTPDYMSPEQREKFSALQPPSDVYALGVILFELLTGKNPYYEEPGCKVSDFRSIDPTFEELINRMLQDDPRQRPWNGKRLQEILLSLIYEDDEKNQKSQMDANKGIDWLPPKLEMEADMEVQPNHKVKETPNSETKDKIRSLEDKDHNSNVQIDLVEPQAGQVKTVELGDGVSMEFVYVPAGEFWMGADESDKKANEDEKPKHKVYLDAYWIGKYPVTNRQYTCFINETNHKRPEHWKNGQIPNNKEDHPVVNVSWHDAEAFTKWLSKKSSLTIKLPTEAEWEKAARGTDGRIYPWGNEIPNKNLANFSAGDTTAVGSYQQGASVYGVMDMSGNVWEWVADWYQNNYYSKAPVSNPPGPANSTFKVIRGGSWYRSDSALRTSYRLDLYPVSRYIYVGFRCAASP